VLPVQGEEPRFSISTPWSFTRESRHDKIHPVSAIRKKEEIRFLAVGQVYRAGQTSTGKRKRKLETQLEVGAATIKETAEAPKYP